MSTNFRVTIEPHPSQARHPITNEPLVKDGKPVPLFPDERSIRLDGDLIGYVGNKESGRAVMFIVPKGRFAQAIIDEVTKSVVVEFGDEYTGKVRSVPDPDDLDEDYEDE